MPRRLGPVRHLHLISLPERLQQNGMWQMHWYDFISKTCVDMRKGLDTTILDVGAGDGRGLLHLLRNGATTVHAIDPRPLSAHVCAESIESIPSKSWDLVLAIDVLEHVEDHQGFIQHLLRVSRWGVFIATPNWNKSFCSNPYHIREYTPAELVTLLRGLPCTITCWMSGDNLDHESASWPFSDDEARANFGVLLLLDRGTL